MSCIPTGVPQCINLLNWYVHNERVFGDVPVEHRVYRFIELEPKSFDEKNHVLNGEYYLAAENLDRHFRDKHKNNAHEYYIQKIIDYMAAKNQVTALTDAKQLQAFIAPTTTTSIVDFYGNGCGPCIKFAPVFQKLASEFSKTIRFGKMNVHEVKGGEEIAAQYEIEDIPTILLFKDGQVLVRCASLAEASLRTILNEQH